MIVRLFPDERCPFLPVAVTSEARGTVRMEMHACARPQERGTVLSEVRGAVRRFGRMAGR